MTMDEVNERFPLTKYKAWVTTRAEKGLSTEGGVSTRSRPASVKLLERVLSNSETTRKTEEGERSTPMSGPSPEVLNRPIPTDSSSPDPPLPDSNEKLKDPIAKETKPSPTLSPVSSAKENKTSPPQSPVSVAKEIKHSPPQSPVSPMPQQEVHEDEDDDMDDDDQIQMAVPTEMLATPGDACAICLDTLEDDDDVRGLTCGHAFHAGCVDPWLTSRRACCPLCKTDYHIPKPRPEGEAAVDPERQTGRRQAGPSGGRDNPPNTLPYGMTGGRTATSFRPRLIFPGRFLSIGNRDSRQSRQGPPVMAQLTRPATRRPNQATMATPIMNSGANPEAGISPGWRSRIRGWRPTMSLPNRLRRNDNAVVTAEPNGSPQAGAATMGTSPGQLEAGIR